jgi:two-component system, OmpR family, KDP operon response regulator KdpE
MAGGPIAVLIIEDEPAISRLLRVSLAESGYQVIEAGSGQEGMRRLRLDRPNIIVLDLGLPDVNGLDVIREIRQHSPVPIVVLSSRADERGKVAALDLGADDYVTKPFGIDELTARLRAALRHRLHQQGEPATFITGDLVVDRVRRLVQVRGTEVKLSPREYDILQLLVQHAGKVLTHQFILREVWKVPTDVQYLRIYIKQLRHKVEPDPQQPRYILTETGIGYRLRAPDQYDRSHSPSCCDVQ